MISLNIPEVKAFMSKLLMNATFDQYLLKEMELQTFTGFTITGQLNEAFFTKEELEERSECKSILWSEVRQVVFSMIKGNKTPLSLKIIFQLPKDQCELMVNRLGGKIRVEEVGGLYMNVRFEKGELRIISGTAIKTFTLDKTLEQEWDLQVKTFLEEQGIICEENE
ncbi:MAG TPA: DUF5721 family protein [Mobilitalea sp.]|nr:DUF5721 family protein [Mobilitalea sp.]